MPFRELEPNVWQELDTGRIYQARSEIEAAGYHADWRARQELNAIRLRDGVDWEKLPDYVPVLASPRRRLPQPGFKLDIQTVEDLSLRLSSSVVYIGPDPVLVTNVGSRNGHLYLVVRNWRGEDFRIAYSDPKLDLRSAEPQYIVYENRPVFVYRQASRQQKQGMDTQNMLKRNLGSSSGASRIGNSLELCRGLSDGSLLEWTPQLYDLMVKTRAFQSLRLSPSVGFFTHNEEVRAEYKGRTIGDVKDNTILADETDAARPWLKRAANEVGCELRSK